MKTPHKFDLLPKKDQQFILDLCSKLPYAEAAEILRKPRPEGLALATSSSALCRWFTKRQAEVATTQVLGQLSKAIQVRHQSDASGHTEALLTLVQNRLFESLLAGKAVADLSSEFRVMLNLHRAYLAEARWQASEKPDADYKAYLSRACELPDFDCCDPADTSGRIQELTVDSEPEELLLEKAQETNLREELMQKLIQNMTAVRAQSSSGTDAKPAQPQPHSTPVPSKKPVIPPIPPDSTTAPKVPHPQSQIPNPTSDLPDPVRSAIAATFADPIPQPAGTSHLKIPAIPHIPPNSTLLPRPITKLAA